MNADDDPVVRVQSLVRARRYRVGLHAARHMVEKGFDEHQWKLRVIEAYPEESGFLVLGQFRFTPSTRSPLHVLCDFSNEGIVDIVTAYIPRRPWWVTPTQRRGR